MGKTDFFFLNATGQSFPALITAPEIKKVTFPASWNGLPVWKHRAGTTWGPGKGRDVELLAPK